MVRAPAHFISGRLLTSWSSKEWLASARCRKRCRKAGASLVDAREFPHLHGDHPLSMALGRMGTTHLDVLSVVSHVDVHKSEGVVTLHDVLSFYGFAGAIGS